MSNQAEPSYTDLLQENELLKQEINALRLENDDLRRSKFEFQNSAEMQEEYLTNKLMKTIKEMNEQKERLISKINSEEELANCHLAQVHAQFATSLRIILLILLLELYSCCYNRMLPLFYSNAGMVTVIYKYGNDSISIELDVLNCYLVLTESMCP
eukprot:TRINITY_DN4189_c0_g1_i1.p1 TRINITY_DN4189_c0_g1~~TRINITY_DN4189_c0_g1_i1.p1  ORF type:complete len:169 (-),score=28.23 TRINITY_DN4189_c0_g1_i1:279-746(-)